MEVPEYPLLYQQWEPPQSKIFKHLPVLFDRTALMEAQKYAIDAYVDLVEHNLLLWHVALEGWTEMQHRVAGHPMQDPIGALFAALVAIRRMAPNRDCLMPRRPEDTEFNPSTRPDLTFRCRRFVGAIVAVCHKFYTNSPPAKNSHASFMYTMRLLTAEEQARWQPHLQTVCQRQMGLEAEIALTQPILAICRDNPLAQCEHELSQLLGATALTEDHVLLMRGAAFFFLAACTLDPLLDIFETLNRRVSTEVLGRALLSILVSGAREVASPGTAYCCSFGDNVNYCAGAMLCSVRAPHADALRIGPYAPPCVGTKATVAQEMTSPRVVEALWNVYRHSSW